MMKKICRHDCFKNRRVEAFTLAEVLITLAIIGVVAAITIPSIVANHQKRALETQFAKAYRTLSQAVNLAVAEHGGIETWDWKETWTAEEKDEFVKKYLLPYLNYTKFCSASKPNTGCFPVFDYKYLNGVVWANYAVDAHPKALLADGTSVHFATWNDNPGSAMTIGVDINGHKKPNIVGRDVFCFGLYKQTGEFLPAGINASGTYNATTNSFAKMTREEALNSCKNAASSNCTAVMVMDGFKMNY